MMMASTLNVKVVPCYVSHVPTQPYARHVQSIVILPPVIALMDILRSQINQPARCAHINAPHAQAHRIIVPHVPVIDKVLPNVIVLLVKWRPSIKPYAEHQHAHTNA